MSAKGQEFCLECQHALTRESSSELRGAGAPGAWTWVCAEARSSGSRTLALVAAQWYPRVSVNKTGNEATEGYCCSHLLRMATDFNLALACESRELNLYEPRPAHSNRAPVPGGLASGSLSYCYMLQE